MKNRDLVKILERGRDIGSLIGRLAFFQIALLLALFPLQAQEKEEALDPIIIRASKSKQKVFDLPGMNSVIDLDNPSMVMPSTLDDIFVSQPWLDFVKSARRNGQVPAMRGYGGDSIIVLFDGVRQNFDSAHDGQFFIDPALLKRVEVLRGPNSALYGSGGLGGVIAFETKDAADLLRKGENFGVLLNSGYQSVNGESLASVSAFGRTETLDILGNYSLRSSGDIKVPDEEYMEPGGREGYIPSDDTVTSGLFKLGWSLSEHHTIRVAFQGYHNKALEPNQPQGDIGRVTDALMADVNKDTESYTTRLGYEYNNPQQPYLQFKSQLYSTRTFVREEYAEDVIALGPPIGMSMMPSMTVEALKGDTLLRKLETVGGSLDFQSFFGKKGGLSNTLSYGVEFYGDTQNGDDSGNDSGGDVSDEGYVPVGERGGVPDAEADYLGIYLQDEVSLPTSIGEFLFIPGLRHDSYKSRRTLNPGEMNEEELENEDKAASAKLAVSYKPVKWLMIFGSYGEAFRAPSLTELYVSGTHFPVPRVDLPDDPTYEPPCVAPVCTSFLPGGSNVFDPNPELKPERSVNMEGGFGFRFQDLISKEDLLELKASYFDTKSEDYIDQIADVKRRPTVNVVMGSPLTPPTTVEMGECCGTTYSVNVPQAQLWGYEAELKYESSRLDFTLSYSYINGVVREGEGRDGRNNIRDKKGDHLGNLTPDKYSGDLGIKVPEIFSVFGIRAQIARKHHRAPPATSDDQSTRDIDETTFPDEGAKRDSYVVYDLYYQFQSKSVLEGLTFKFGIENVSDKKYSRIYAGSLEPGRNYKASLSYQW